MNAPDKTLRMDPMNSPRWFFCERRGTFENGICWSVRFAISDSPNSFDIPMAFPSLSIVLFLCLFLLFVHLRPISAAVANHPKDLNPHKRTWSSALAVSATANREKRQPLGHPSDEGSAGPNLDPAASGGVWTRWKRWMESEHGIKRSPFT
ncbi:hypothetical protein niasHT_038100 [Heterodera trifolii]|uniref:Uncharacterized protein n=1 Tax=Heterodera trifolii TaxID=157864 RepID=A0ABD2HTU3_9BILA